MARYLKKYWLLAIFAALFMVGEVYVDLYPRAKRTPSICSLIKTYGW